MLLSIEEQFVLEFKAITDKLLMDPFEGQSDEVLIEFLLQVEPEDLPALCSSNDNFRRLCADKRIKPILEAYNRKREQEDFLQFTRLVVDGLRNPGKWPYSTAISDKDLKQLEQLALRRPAFLNRGSFNVQVMNDLPDSPSPLAWTRSPLVMDLLLRYGSNPNLDPRILEALLGRDISVANNAVIISQLIAYRFMGTPKVEKLIPRYYPLYYFLKANGRVDLRSPPSSLFFPECYFYLLDLLRSGVKTGFAVGFYGGGFYGGFTMGEMINQTTSRELHYLQYCFDDYNAPPLRGWSDETYRFYRSLQDPGAIYDRDPKVYMGLSYQQLKQLQNIGPKSNPYWDDNVFWAMKLDQDFPQPPDYYDPSKVGKSNREKYLYFLTVPTLTFLDAKGKRVNLCLEYQTGLGLLTCWRLLQLERTVPLLDTNILNIKKLSHLDTDAFRLYHVNFPDPKYRKPSNDDNLNLNLIATKDQNGMKIHIPNIFYPYAMEISDGSKTYSLQMISLDFFKGYLLLCSLLSIPPQANLYRVK